MNASIVSHGFGTPNPGSRKICQAGSEQDGQTGGRALQVHRLPGSTEKLPLPPSLVTAAALRTRKSWGTQGHSISHTHSVVSAKWLQRLTSAPGQALAQLCTGNDFQMTNISLVVSKCHSWSQVLITESKHVADLLRLPARPSLSCG